MKSRTRQGWTAHDALSRMEQAERLRRQFCRAGAALPPCWEPPIDVLEGEESVIVHVALPGVAAPTLVVAIDAEGIAIAGVRPFPGAPASRIQRIEIPYGRFERRVPLPMHALELTSQELADGCLVLVLRKRKDTP